MASLRLRPHELQKAGNLVSCVQGGCNEPSFLLSVEQLERIKPFFPLSHGIPQVDDLKVISGIDPARC